MLPETPRHPLLVMKRRPDHAGRPWRMLQFHQQGGHKITVAVEEYAHTVPFGCLEVDGDRVARLEEKPVLSPADQRRHLRACHPECWREFPRDKAFPLRPLDRTVLWRVGTQSEHYPDQKTTGWTVGATRPAKAGATRSVNGLDRRFQQRYES